MSKGITDMPPDCCLIRAELIREGDRVRFRMASSDYTVEEIETDSIGHIRHRTDNGTRTCGYHPGELLWITRRDLHDHHHNEFARAERMRDDMAADIYRDMTRGDDDMDDYEDGDEVQG